MPGLDTNVLVRWLVDDDAAQTERVQVLLESAGANSEPLFVPATVLLELEWVLRARYRFEKARVLGAFTALLETHELEFQSEAAVERALHFYREGGAEFADCLHAGLCGAADRWPMLTFDKQAARLAHVELIS